MYNPARMAVNWKIDSPPGGVWEYNEPPPVPRIPCESIECDIVLLAMFLICISTNCPSRRRIIGPGTVPLKVQYMYVMPSANCPINSCVTNVTTTLSPG